MNRAVTLLTGLLSIALPFSCVSKQDHDVIKEDISIAEEEPKTVFAEELVPETVNFYRQDLEYKVWLRATKSYPFNVEGYYFLPRGRWLMVGNKDHKALSWSLADNVVSLSWFDSSLERNFSQDLQLSSLSKESLEFIDDTGKKFLYQYIKQDTLIGSWELVFAHGKPEPKKKVWIEFFPSQESDKGLLLGSTGINSFRLVYEDKEVWKMSSAIAHTRAAGAYQEERFERHFLALLRNINRIIKTDSFIFCYTASQLELVFRRQ